MSVSSLADRAAYVKAARARIAALPPDVRRDLDMWWARCKRDMAEERAKRDDPRWVQ